MFMYVTSVKTVKNCSQELFSSIFSPVDKPLINDSSVFVYSAKN